MDNRRVFAFIGAGLLAAGIAAVLIGLYYLKQTQSVKGYYLMAYAGITFGMYVLSYGLTNRVQRLTGASVMALLVFGGMLLYGLTTLTENLSTKGYYFAMFMMVSAGAFILPMALNDDGRDEMRR